MAGLPFPLANGVRYDHSSLDIRIVNTSFLGVKAIDYEDNLESAEVRGTSAQKIADTRGQYKATASLEIWRAEYDQFAQLVIALGGGGLYEVRFPIDVNYAQEGGLPPVTDNILYCRITKVHAASSNGTEPLSVKIDLNPMLIIRNGIFPFANLKR